MKGQFPYFDYNNIIIDVEMFLVKIKRKFFSCTSCLFVVN